MATVAESSTGPPVPSTTRPFINAIRSNPSSSLAVPNAATLFFRVEPFSQISESMPI
jgi:hypothetical protein